LMAYQSVVQWAVKRVDGRVAMLAILMAGRKVCHLAVQWAALTVDLKVASLVNLMVGRLAPWMVGLLVN